MTDQFRFRHYLLHQPAPTRNHYNLQTKRCPQRARSCSWRKLRSVRCIQARHPQPRFSIKPTTISLHTPLQAGYESCTLARGCHRPTPTRCTWAATMPTPPRLPLLLLLLLWGAGGASAQFDRDWINFVLPRFKQYQKERYENTIFKNVRREWPGGGSVHHIVPLNALMKCVALISSLGTNDLDQVVAAMQAFVNAMPELSNAATRSVMQKHYDDYIYRLELMLEVRTAAVQMGVDEKIQGFG